MYTFQVFSCMLLVYLPVLHKRCHTPKRWYTPRNPDTSNVENVSYEVDTWICFIHGCAGLCKHRHSNTSHPAHRADHTDVKEVVLCDTRALADAAPYLALPPLLRAQHLPCRGGYCVFRRKCASSRGGSEAPLNTLRYASKQRYALQLRPVVISRWAKIPRSPSICLSVL